MKPKLKAPGTKRLKLDYDAPLSSFAFNFNLRRYTMKRGAHAPARELAVKSMVRRCRLTLRNPC